MSPAKLVNWQRTQLSCICYRYFGETTRLENLIAFPRLSRRNLPFFPPLFSSFSEEPEYLTPELSAQVPQAPPNALTPEKRREEKTVPWLSRMPQLRPSSASCSLQQCPEPRAAPLPSHAAGQHEGASEQLRGCGQALCPPHGCELTNLWHPDYKNYHLPPLPSPEESPATFFQAAFYIVKEVLWLQCTLPTALPRYVPADHRHAVPAVQVSPQG